ncbi:MAG: ATP-binding protein [Candidatus Polarisedimenticolia bacterium]
MNRPSAPALLLDGRGVIVMASATAAELLGLAPGEIEGRPLSGLLASPPASVTEALMLDLTVEARLAASLRRGEDLLEVDIRLRPVAGAVPDGPVFMAALELVEARPRAAAETAVAPRAGVEAVSDAVVVCRDGVILEASDDMGELLGVPAARLTGWTVKSLVAAEDLLPVVEILRRVQSGDPARAEFGFHLLRAQGRPLEVAARARRGTHAGRDAVLVGVTDISTSVRAARLAADRLLHLDAALAATSDAVLIVGLPEAGSPVILASPALREMFGVTSARFLGRPFWDLWREIRPAHTFPDDDERVLRGLLEEPEAVRVDTLLLSHPKRCVVERFFGPMRGPDGSILGRVCTFRDVTQRAEAEAEMRSAAEDARHAREELEGLHGELKLANEGLERRMTEMQRLNRDLRSLDEMKSNLLANVSHELQTPLVSIKGFTEMILKGRLGGVTPEQEHGLQLALRNINRLIGLIENLLSFARSEGPFTALRLEVFPLGPLVQEVFELLREKAAARGITLRADLPAGDLSIRADRDKILQVLLNLIGNAVKYNRDGGDVLVDAEGGQRGTARVEVRDTGVGIPRDELEKIFDRFYRAGSPAADREGAGIGLSITRNLLRQHGCMIRVDSDEGKGSVFSFTLPLDRKGRAERGAPRASARSHEAAGSPETVGEPSREET